MSALAIDSAMSTCVTRLRTHAQDPTLPNAVRVRLYQLVDFIESNGRFGRAAEHVEATRTMLLEEYGFRKVDDLPSALNEMRLALMALSERVEG